MRYQKALKKELAIEKIIWVMIVKQNIKLKKKTSEKSKALPGGETCRLLR